MAKSILFTHAHPDDETINNGLTMALYAERGYDVHLVTCTAGEEGEILLGDLAHLAADKEDGLGEVRKVELELALAELGDIKHYYLGGFGTFRDSGMMGMPSNSKPNTFWQADLLEASKHLVKLIRQIKPDVLVTYDEFGGYGHPDHIQTHRVSMYAAQLAATHGFLPESGEPWQIKKIYWNAIPRERMMNAIACLAERGVTSEFLSDMPGDAPFLTDDSLITSRIVAPQYTDKKLKALAAHKTQVDLQGEFFTTMQMLGDDLSASEYYRMVYPKSSSQESREFETDLFADI
ncbi:MAG: hypothetical protein RIS09_241 [Actinomycetota bacterium]|jgi:N-acetyl-1-D-myo-inositol-2-amino-2-deoxy-alpha-D-glucopyranoside deacetylase